MSLSILHIPQVKTIYKTNGLKYFSFFLIAVGLSICLYLFYSYLNFAILEKEGKANLCSTIFGSSCDTALQSDISMQLGLPLSAWGILYYLAIILYLSVPLLFGDSFKQKSGLIIFILSLAGLLAAIFLIGLMIIKPAIFCPFCTIIHAINMILFFTLQQVTGFSFWHFPKAFQKISKSIFSRQIIEPANIWKLFGFLTTIAFIGALYFTLTILTVSANQQPAFIDSKPIIAEFESQQKQNIPISPDEPMNGDPDSPIQLVVFSDFYCPGCRKISHELTNIITKSGGRYSLVFKHFPLSSTCNPDIKGNLHPLACEASIAAEAAHQQGKFWVFHDSLFATEPNNNPAHFRSIAEKINLNLSEFDKYLISDEAKNKMAKSMSEAKQMGITVTPSVFLNGRRVNDLRPGILQFLINQEIKKTTPSPNSSN